MAANTSFATQLSEHAGLNGWQRFESALDGFGLMRGGWAPLKRFAVGATVGFLLGEAIRPQWSHHRNGRHKIWAYAPGSNGEGTMIPWWTAPLAGGILMSVFI